VQGKTQRSSLSVILFLVVFWGATACTMVVSVSKLVALAVVAAIQLSLTLAPSSVRSLSRPLLVDEPSVPIAHRLRSERMSIFETSGAGAAEAARVMHKVRTPSLGDTPALEITESTDIDFEIVLFPAMEGRPQKLSARRMCRCFTLNDAAPSSWGGYPGKPGSMGVCPDGSMSIWFCLLL
jgi:hypothetical protein